MSKIFINADFVPMTDVDATFEALVEEEGRIAFTGSEADARAAFPDAEVVDMQGRTVLPGLIDPHSHFMMSTQMLLNADLTEATCFDDIVRILRAFIEEHGITADGVVVGNGYDHNALAEGRHPDRHVLDRVSTEIPVVVIHASVHLGSMNSKALELAGITAETPDPEGGAYLREADGATPLGPWEEPVAQTPVSERVIDPRSVIDYPAIVDDLQNLYLEHGVTTCQEGATRIGYANDLTALAEQGRLKLDVVAYPVSMLESEPDVVMAQHPEYDGPSYRGHLRFGGIKLFLDGSPQGRTAWISKPYEVVNEGDDPEYCGYPQRTDEAVYGYCRMAIDSNHQILVHCNGDAASDQFLRCYEQALADSDNPGKHELRPVMVHCQTTRRDQLEKMVELGMIPSIFVSHVWFWGDVHIKNFGWERANRISPVRDALDLGLVYNFHTDTPIIPCDLLFAVWCAVMRMTKGGVHLGAEQAVGVFDALKGITVNAAYLYSEEGVKGTLEVGKLADLAVLDANPLKVEPQAIRDITVLETIKEGESVWMRR